MRRAFTIARALIGALPSTAQRQLWRETWRFSRGLEAAMQGVPLPAVFSAAWTASGHSVPPSFNGVPYDRMVDDPATPVDEAHMFMPHFDRHVWIFRDNPNGIFSPFNPAVSCQHHKGARHFPGH